MILRPVMNLSCGPANDGPALEAISQRIDALIDPRFEQYKTFFQDIHAHPELAQHERNTSEKIAAEMKALGFAVTIGVGRYEDGSPAHGVVSVLANGRGPVALLRTELDGLPIKEQSGLPYSSKNEGVMHSCGHDLHMTIAAASAYALSQMKDVWRGTLIMVAQPAEETGAGAKAMIRDGLFTRFPKPDYALALHASSLIASGKIHYRAGAAYSAADIFDITMIGKGGHGSRPDRTIDPITMAAELLVKFQILRHEISPLEPNVISVGSIKAGEAANIIPSTAEVKGSIRSFNEDVRAKLKQRVAEAAKAVAVGSKAPEPRIEFPAEAPAVHNNPKLLARLLPAFRAAAGNNNVGEDEPRMGSEDFSQYSVLGQIPAVIFWLGVTPNPGPDVPDIHSPQFVAEFGPAFRSGVKAMVISVVALSQR